MGEFAAPTLSISLASPSPHPSSGILPYRFILFSQICFSRPLLVSELKDQWLGFTYAEQTRLVEPKSIENENQEPTLRSWIPGWHRGSIPSCGGVHEVCGGVVQVGFFLPRTTVSHYVCRHYELTHPLKTRRVYVASDDPKVDILGLICSYLLFRCLESVGRSILR